MKPASGRTAAPRRRLLRADPLLHLVAGGALLFAASAAVEAWRGRAASGSGAPGAQGTATTAAVRQPIVLDGAAVRALERGFVTRWGRPPEPAERRALLAEAAQDEMLYREARVLQLGHGDASVRRRLLELLRALSEPRAGRDDDQLVAAAVELGLDDDVIVRRLLMEKMRLILQQDPAGASIDDDVLADVLARHGSELVQPESVSLEQLFVSTDRRGAAAAAVAQRIATGLRSGALDLDAATSRSDALPLPADLRLQPRLKLQARFGKDFADAVLALPPGTWSEPIASPFGLHVVRVVERRPERVPTVDEARPALVEIARREHARASLARGLARLRELYEVRVADTDTAPAGSNPGAAAMAGASRAHERS